MQYYSAQKKEYSIPRGYIYIKILFSYNFKKMEVTQSPITILLCVTHLVIKKWIRGILNLSSVIIHCTQKLLRGQSAVSKNMQNPISYNA